MLKLLPVFAILCFAGCNDQLAEAPKPAAPRPVEKKPTEPPSLDPEMKWPAPKPTLTPTATPSASSTPTPVPSGPSESYQFVHGKCCFGMHEAAVAECSGCRKAIGVKGHSLCVKCANEKQVCPHCLKN